MQSSHSSSVAVVTASILIHTLLPGTCQVTTTLWLTAIERLIQILRYMPDCNITSFCSSSGSLILLAAGRLNGGHCKSIPVKHDKASWLLYAVYLWVPVLLQLGLEACILQSSLTLWSIWSGYYNQSSSTFMADYFESIYLYQLQEWLGLDHWRHHLCPPLQVHTSLRWQNNRCLMQCTSSFPVYRLLVGDALIRRLHCRTQIVWTVPLVMLPLGQEACILAIIL